MGVGRLHKNYKLPLLTIAITSLFISAIALFFFGHSGSFLILSLLMIVIGGSGGLVESIGTTLLADGEQSRQMLYTSQVFFGIGAFSAPLIVGVLLKQGLQVPQISMVTGSFAFAVGILVLILVLPSSKDKLEHHSIAEPETGAIIPDSGTGKGFMWLFFTMMAYIVLENSLASWLPAFLEKTYHVSPAIASLTLTCYWIGLTLSRLFFVFFKKKTTHIPLLFHVLFLLATLFLFVIVGPTASSLGTMVIISLAGIASGPIWVLIIENCKENYKDPHLIMYLVGGGSIGALIGPILSSSLFAITDIAYLGYILIAYGIILGVLTVRAISLEKPLGVQQEA